MQRHSWIVAVGLAALAGAMPVGADDGRWESEVDLSVGGSSGNTRTFDLRTAARTERTGGDRRLRLDATYFYSESDGEQNQGRFSAGARNECASDESPRLYFLQGRYDQDEFRAWTHRAATHGGLGHRFVQREGLELIGRIGLGASKEWDRTEPVQPEGVLGFEADWRINDRQRLQAETTLFPNLDDLPEYRWVTTVAWRVQVNELRGISLSLGAESEYESETEPGIRGYDIAYFVGLTVAF
jgi:putative salt-induced outer membrane protein YdiY